MNSTASASYSSAAASSRRSRPGNRSALRAGFGLFSILLWFSSALFVLWVAWSALFYRDDVGQLVLIGPLLREHQVTAVLILSLFGWVLFEIAVKQRQVSRQHAAVRRFRPLVEEGTEPGSSYQPHAADVKEWRRAIRRADLFIELSRDNDAPNLHVAVPAAAALDARRLAAGYTALNVYAWILPVLGFIGTALGMATAIEGFRSAIPGGRVDINTVGPALADNVIPGLAAAFQTTILALAAALVAYLCTSAVRNWDQKALHDLDDLCVTLLARIPQPPTADGGQIVSALSQIFARIVQISGQLTTIVNSPATVENAASEIRKSAEALSAASGQFGSTVAAVASAATTWNAVIQEFASGASATRMAAESMEAASKELLKPITFKMTRE